jgi:hypothetical protein
MIRRWSLKKKLQGVIMLTVAAALLLASSALMAWEVAAARRSMRTQAEILAGMIAENCTAALVFEDRAAAGELLRGLDAHPAVVSAVIYAASGNRFASYLRPGKESIGEPVPLRESSDFEEGRLVVARRIILGDQNLGWIRIESDLQEMNPRSQIER